MKCVKKFLILAIFLVSLNVLISCRKSDSKRHRNYSKLPTNMPVNSGVPGQTPIGNPSAPLTPPVGSGSTNQPCQCPSRPLNPNQPNPPLNGVIAPNGQCNCNPSIGGIAGSNGVPQPGAFTGRYKKRIPQNKHGKKQKNKKGKGNKKNKDKKHRY